MSATYFYTFTRDDDSEVTIEYSASPYYPATYDDPAEGGEIEIETVFDDKTKDIILTDAEHERALDQIFEHHEADDGPDPDDERDRQADDRRERAMERDRL